MWTGYSGSFNGVKTASHDQQSEGELQESTLHLSDEYTDDHSSLMLRVRCTTPELQGNADGDYGFGAFSPAIGGSVEALSFNAPPSGTEEDSSIGGAIGSGTAPCGTIGAEEGLGY